MNKQIKQKFYVHKAGAKRRGVSFELTFEEWWGIWEASGKWDQRGKGSNAYCMSRFNDVGPYKKSNVFIQTNRENVRQAQIGNHKPRGPMSEEHKRNLSIARTGFKLGRPNALRGRPQTEEHKHKNRMAQLKRNAEIRNKEISR